MRNLRCQARGNVLARITCDVHIWRVNKSSLSEVNPYHKAALGSGVLKTPPTWCKQWQDVLVRVLLSYTSSYHSTKAPLSNTCLSQTLYNLHNRQRR